MTPITPSDGAESESAASQSRYTLTAVVIVPSDQPHDEEAMTEGLRAALVAAGYHVKWVIASEVTVDAF